MIFDVQNLHSLSALGSPEEANVLIREVYEACQAVREVPVSSPIFPMTVLTLEGWLSMSPFRFGTSAKTQANSVLQVPTIAQISGVCIGAGLELAASCDFRYASEDSKFAMPEVQLGVSSIPSQFGMLICDGTLSALRSWKPCLTSIIDPFCCTSSTFGKYHRMATHQRASTFCIHHESRRCRQVGSG